MRDAISKFSKLSKIHFLTKKIIFFSYIKISIFFLFTCQTQISTGKHTKPLIASAFHISAPLRPPCQLTKKIKNNRISNFLESWNICHSQKMNFPNFSSFFDKGKTFRPKKKFQPGTLKYSLHKQAQASLNSGINLRTVSWSDLSEK